MAKFRKKPVVIEAVQLHQAEWIEGGKLDNGIFNEVPAWLEEAFSSMTIHVEQPAQTDYCCLIITTLEGDHRATPGDWIIRGVAGEFYPCKHDIFAMTYEPADAPASERKENGIIDAINKANAALALSAEPTP